MLAKINAIHGLQKNWLGIQWPWISIPGAFAIAAVVSADGENCDKAARSLGLSENLLNLSIDSPGSVMWPGNPSRYGEKSLFSLQRAWALQTEDLPLSPALFGQPGKM
ncbi:unnamed protein product [Natator depressus]